MQETSNRTSDVETSNRVSTKKDEAIEVFAQESRHVLVESEMEGVCVENKTTQASWYMCHADSTKHEEMDFSKSSSSHGDIGQGYIMSVPREELSSCAQSLQHIEGGIHGSQACGGACDPKNNFMFLFAKATKKEGHAKEGTSQG